MLFRGSKQERRGQVTFLGNRNSSDFSNVYKSLWSTMNHDSGLGPLCPIEMAWMLELTECQTYILASLYLGRES